MKTLLKKLFGRLFYRPKKLNCGTFDTRTGESATGYMTTDGSIVYKKDKKSVAVWSSPVYLKTVELKYNVVDNWSGEKIRESCKEYPFYYEANKFNGQRKYFCQKENYRQYFNADAYEKDNKFLPL